VTLPGHDHPVLAMDDQSADPVDLRLDDVANGFRDCRAERAQTIVRDALGVTGGSMGVIVCVSASSVSAGPCDGGHSGHSALVAPFSRRYEWTDGKSCRGGPR